VRCLADATPHWPDLGFPQTDTNYVDDAFMGLRVVEHDELACVPTTAATTSTMSNQASTSSGSMDQRRKDALIAYRNVSKS
jgi:hypothetical protein